jgi:hypothetical protein
VKLNDYRQDFYTYSGKASDLSRQLAFAGIALIWLFKSESAGQFAIPRSLITPSIFIVCALAFDMLHYVMASVIWRWFYRSKEKAFVSEDADLPPHSVALEAPIWIIFCLKIAFVLLAYVWIFSFLLATLTVK